MKINLDMKQASFMSTHSMYVHITAQVAGLPNNTIGSGCKNCMNYDTMKIRKIISSGQINIGSFWEFLTEVTDADRPTRRFFKEESCLKGSAAGSRCEPQPEPTADIDPANHPEIG